MAMIKEAMTPELNTKLLQKLKSIGVRVYQGSGPAKEHGGSFFSPGANAVHLLNPISQNPEQFWHEAHHAISMNLPNSEKINAAYDKYLIRESSPRNAKFKLKLERNADAGGVKTLHELGAEPAEITKFKEDSKKAYQAHKLNQMTELTYAKTPHTERDTVHTNAVLSDIAEHHAPHGNTAENVIAWLRSNDKILRKQVPGYLRKKQELSQQMQHVLKKQPWEL